MTNKRFKMGESDIQGEMIFIDTQTNKIYWQEYFDEIVDLVNEQQSIIKQLEEDKAIAEDYANIFEMENVKLRKKLNTYKATILSFLWGMEQNGQINGKDDDFVKDLFKLIE